MVRRHIKDGDDYWDRDFFDDMFGDFGIDFRRMNDRLMRFFNNVMKNPETTIEGPFVYGFTYRQGPDGRPTFQEFGNVPEMMHRGPQRQIEQDVREPLTDLNEDGNNVYITYELPGISKENIDLNVSERNVTLNVKEGPRKYHKSIDFDFKLKPESCRAKFVNGILDLSIAKEKQSEGNGRKVSIE